MINLQPYTGLVVCGGNSSRMGTDKSLLEYYGRPQRYHIAELLRPFCAKVFLSLNASQAEEGAFPWFTDLPEYENTGPMAALLTAYHYLPGSHFIVIGCDYPLLSSRELEQFIAPIGKDVLSKAFYNRRAGLYEPLLAYYAPPMYHRIREQFDRKRYSLQQVLRDSDAAPYDPADINCIRSVDDPDTCRQVKAWIGGRSEEKDKEGRI